MSHTIPEQIVAAVRELAEALGAWCTEGQDQPLGAHEQAVLEWVRAALPRLLEAVVVETKVTEGTDVDEKVKLDRVAGFVLARQVVVATDAWVLRHHQDAVGMAERPAPEGRSLPPEAPADARSGTTDGPSGGRLGDRLGPRGHALPAPALTHLLTCSLDRSGRPGYVDPTDRGFRPQFRPQFKSIEDQAPPEVS